MLRKKIRPYKIEAWCLDFDEIDEIIQGAWKETRPGSAMFKVQRKLQTVSKKCKKWCLDFKLEHRIHWDIMNEELTKEQEDLSPMRNRAQGRLSKDKMRASTDIKLEYWKQRARTKWDKLGDQQTSFFYKRTKSRQGRNDIRAIKDKDGNWVQNLAEIKEEFVNFFSKLFKPINQRTSFDDCDSWFDNLNKLSETQYAYLDKPFSQDEIRNAMFSMAPLKSPGPDGIPPVFFQKKWDLVNGDLSKATKTFLDGGFMLKETNKTFIALIPKTHRPEQVSQFRPISLCNTSYKIIAKCLVNRLQPLMNSLIGPNQNAFVKGRSINDNCMIAHEMLSYVKKARKGANYSVILNLDLNKAYDRVSWSFIKEVLAAFGFPPLWIHLIMECVTIITYSVLVNGEPTGIINPTAGLRQGDPLSPYLFILCMEVLSRKITQQQSLGLIKGLKVIGRPQNFPTSSLQMMHYSS